MSDVTWKRTRSPSLTVIVLTPPTGLPSRTTRCGTAGAVVCVVTVAFAAWPGDAPPALCLLEPGLAIRKATTATTTASPTSSRRTRPVIAADRPATASRTAPSGARFYVAPPVGAPGAPAHRQARECEQDDGDDEHQRGRPTSAAAFGRRRLDRVSFRCRELYDGADRRADQAVAVAGRGGHGAERSGGRAGHLEGAIARRHHDQQRDRQLAGGQLGAEEARVTLRLAEHAGDRAEIRLRADDGDLQREARLVGPIGHAAKLFAQLAAGERRPRHEAVLQQQHVAGRVGVGECATGQSERQR